MNLRDPLPPGGVTIPIYATFTGVKGIPLWALASNSASPLLRLHGDSIELKVIRRHLKPFESLERVGVMQGMLTNNLTLEWTDSRFNFSANVIRADWLWDTVAFFAQRGAVLTPAARNLIERGRPDLSRPG